MHVPRSPHRWQVSPRRAIAIQQALAPRVISRAGRKRFRLVAGADLAFTPDGGRAIGGIVVWDVRRECVVEERIVTRQVTFPYVPGLLSFREAPVLLAAVRRLQHEPHAFMFDGQGRAHPRRFGLACHVGLLMDRPSIGCAKSRLVGTHAEPGPHQGASAPLEHNGERIGTVLRTRDGVRCVYVSIGHRMDLPTAEKLVLRCTTRYRLPEPTRLADQLVARARRALGA